MIAQVHIHPKVEKRLAQLKKKENAPSIAAKRAETIIQTLVNGVQLNQVGNLSKSKDARIKDLYKFNLGSGYRLICIKKKYNIYILFIGSHDHCDTWLDKNSKKKPHKTILSMNIYDVKPSEAPSQPGMSNSPDEIENNRVLIPEISQQDLRKVFKGLINNR